MRMAVENLTSSDPPPLFDGTTRWSPDRDYVWSHVVNRYTSYLRELHYIHKNYACRKIIAKCDFIKWDSDFDDIFQRLKSQKKWSEFSDSSLKTALIVGLQEKIKLVPIDLQNRPDWYKEKVYPPNKVPSLEHNNEIRGVSLDLLKYIDSYFEGPALYPDDPTKREFAEELLSYTNTFNLAVITSLKEGSENEISTAFDYLESALFKFTDGPFFLG
ncbi:unnamed protein product [Camellia sinensis]